MLVGACIALPNLVAAQEAEIVSGPIPLRIAAGPASEPMFAAAGIVANIVSNPPGGPACPAAAVCGPPGLVGEARSTVSGIANIESLATGENETAFVEGDVLWQAYNGFGRFAGRAGGGIPDIAGLRRKTVALGDLDDPHFHIVSAILGQHGVRERELTLVHLGADSAATALLHGEVDAAIVVAPALPQAFRDIAERLPLRLLAVEAKAVQALLRQQPYLIEVEIGDLAEGRRRTSGLALPVLWVTTQRLPPQIGYGLIRSLQAPSNQDAMAQALPQGSAVAARDELTRSPIPLHIGAARWSEEASGVAR
jgi:TRAP-type uncharacterized transport system substrate-binding protein